MVKHTQTIRCRLPTNYLSMFDHFVGLALKVLRKNGFFISRLLSTMDALLAVEKETNKFEVNFETCKKNLMKNIDELIKDVEDIKHGLCQGRVNFLSNSLSSSLCFFVSYVGPHLVLFRYFFREFSLH